MPEKNNSALKLPRHPRRIEPVDPDRLGLAYEVYIAGYMGRIASIKKKKLADFEVEGQIYRFTDDPMNRGACAVMTELQPDDREWMSLFYRLLTLIDLIRDNPAELTHHVRDPEGNAGVTKSLMRVAAVAGLKRNGKFDVADCVRLLKLQEPDAV